jgi:preprotein translocase subunit SecE
LLFHGVFRVFDKVKEFFEEVKAELAKVTWPVRKETFATTWVVVVIVVLVSFYLGLSDLILNKLMRLVLS